MGIINNFLVDEEVKYNETYNCCDYLKIAIF